MVETVFKFSQNDEKAIEKFVFDENINYIHVVLKNGDGFPEHYSNSNVYMTVLRGMLSIGLDDQEIHDYGSGTLLKIPNNTKMSMRNSLSETLELIIVKAPAPAN